MRLEFLRHGTVAALALASGILLLSLAGFFDGLNRSFFDWSMRQQARNLQAPEEAVLILIDEPSIDFMARTYNQRWPWSRDAFASLFLALHQAGAKQIVVDLMFLENSDRIELDDLLASYSAAIPGLILAAPHGKTPVFWTEAFSAQHPTLRLKQRVGHTDFQADPDGVIRRYLWPDSLAAKASPYFPASGELLLRWYGGLKDLPRAQILSAKDFLESSYGPAGFFAQLGRSGIDEYNPEQLQAAFPRLPVLAKGSLKGKTVFVGTNVAAAFDVKAVPVSDLEPGVLVHFTAWANARQKIFIPEFNLGNRLSLSAVAACLLAFVLTGVGWNRANVKLLSWLTLLGVITLLSASYLILPILYLPPTAPVASLFLVFGLLTTRHWLVESRRKQEVQNLFGSYLSPAVVQRLVEHPESLKLTGEKKELSVYFSDLAGFTDMSETMAPEKLVELMNVYLSEMSEFIMEERGYLDKYIGDAIMGVFGAPEALENHALSACRAALKSREHLKQLNHRLGLSAGKELYARIGINTGEMIVGNLGSARKRNYTVVGDAVNLASRLEGANKEFGTTILLGMRTEELAREGILTRPVELLRVKGKKHPVQTHELLSMKSTATERDLEAAALFSLAYGHYQQRNFSKALPDFERTALIWEGDTLSQLYVGRCRGFLLAPPPADWDGVFVMKRK